MANTYTLIETKELSTTTASVEFSSIPQTYTDLMLKVSARSTEVDTFTSLRVYFNGVTTNQTAVEGRVINTTIVSYSVAYAQAGYLAGGQTDANLHGSANIYVPNYTGATSKVSAGDVFLASNTAAQNVLVFSSRKWTVTDAVTSITVAPANGSWVQYSNFYLYGIKNT